MGTREKQRTVVVTGLGATTPLGGDTATSWQGLLDGKSGVRRLDLSTDGHPLPVTLAAPVAVDPAASFSAVRSQHLDRCAQLGLVAAREAWLDSGRELPDRQERLRGESARTAVVVGAGLGSLLSLTRQYDQLTRYGPQRVAPRCIPMILPNHPAVEIGLLLGARAGVHTSVSACSSGAEALAQALRLIRSGPATCVLAGGTEAGLHPLIVAGFDKMQALSRRNDSPEDASRPFDTARDGFVLAEGAAMLVLEDAERAAARGARIYCELAGAGVSNDSHHVARPHPTGEGYVRAVLSALADGGLAPEALDHVSAHATSTPVGDLSEAIALSRALGPAAQHITVSAVKAATGHSLGAAGAIEAMFTVLALRHRIAPPHRNLGDLDPAVHLDVVGPEPRPLPDGDLAALNAALGFGGHNVALVFRRNATDPPAPPAPLPKTQHTAPRQDLS
ncbi:beta-ketoacyl-[acyl-carrier-protein] synthase family protein [Streptomyces paromomycinus]|uniref:beta-ketoacyl-[acyl-carrier-protein] synthase family protein n=1 Tax=Streptomyces paromomycinus TaxID=92743 RepID=UPI001FEC4A2D|nr:beta-ketoacyl-[acyl-carrier-protein] synthase family protein [Streptomyces paromomycinus]